jgi:16S rRNA (uracil1498-N3)-methyltransferase
MSLFYCPTISIAPVLSEEESQHAVKVLRMQTGDVMALVDGVGGYYKAQITNPHPKHCRFEIIETFSNFGKRDYKLHIAIAPTKNIERLEWFVEKATEIGIDEITPIICRFSERKIVKEERLEKIIVSATKQSIKAYFPKLNPLCAFDELFKNNQVSQKFIAHCYDDDKKLLQNEIKKSSDVLILIGPEGDFSKEEVQKAISWGFVPVSLGNSRLRTETAGMVACHTVAIINQMTINP